MAKKSPKAARKKAPKKPVAKAPVPAAKTVVPGPQKHVLPSIIALTKTAGATLWQHRKLIAGITLVYGLLNLILVRGLAGGVDLTNLKQNLNGVFTGHFGDLGSGLSIFVLLIGSSGNSSSQTAGVYQFFLGVIASLAIIWALRQLAAGSNFRIRDAYYRGMYPLIPFILVLIVICIQLIPLLIGSSLYLTVVTGGIAVHFIEKALWALAFLLLALVSLYMLTSSVFGLYIVTLADMTPLKALRSARELIKAHRWAVMRKLLALPALLFIAAAIIMVPIIIWLTPIAQWVFFLLSMFALTATHAYIYTLYRELLNE